MMSPHLPEVLQSPSPYSSLSMRRALKQILDLLENHTVVIEAEADKLQASIDDVEVMLLCIR